MAQDLTNNLPKITDEDNEMLEGPITYEECIAAIKSFQNNKTPGIDGLTKEFYSKLFPLFGKHFVNIINFSYDIQQLSNSQRLGLITLICKNNDEPEHLKNWRPISLLNCDYKIISKVITNRLSKILHKIIDIDQTSSIPGRSILDNCHLFRNILDYLKEKPTTLAFISVDQEKAFDNISHTYLFTVLQQFGFSTKFIDWIKLLYNNIHSKIILNNHISSSFQIHKGVRQGCPLSPLLYVLVFETLLTKIRTSPNINGLKLPGTNEEAKLSAFADDATLILTDYNSIFSSFQILTNYEQASGAKLNKSKSCGVWLSKWKNNKDKLCNIHWTNDKHKILGFFFGNGTFDKMNWKKPLDKFKKSVQFIRKRKLSLFGKSKLLNTNSLTKFIYISSILDLSNQTLKEIETTAFEYIWNNKTEPISRKTIMLPIIQGGLGLQKLDIKIKALHVMHIKNLLFGHPNKWRHLATYWLGHKFRNIKPEYASNTIPHSENIPQFYQKAYTQFSQIHTDQINWEKINTKQAYTFLLQKQKHTSRIENKIRDIDFKKTWQFFKITKLEPHLKDLSWKIAHRAIPTNTLLTKIHISKIKSCYFCTGEETLEHLFFNCRTIQPFIHYIDLLITAYTKTPYILTAKHILYHNIDILRSPYHNRIIHYLISLSKSTIWTLRNDAKFNNKNITTDTITHRFIRLLISKIKYDYFKENIYTFNKIWLDNDTFCEIENNDLIMNIP